MVFTVPGQAPIPRHLVVDPFVLDEIRSLAPSAADVWQGPATYSNAGLAFLCEARRPHPTLPADETPV